MRFTTAAGLVNELVEAKHKLELRRVMARWNRYDLIAIDEVGYVPLAEVGAEFLFQVVAERAERAAVVLTTNLPFSRVDPGHSQRAAVQSAARSNHRSRSHPGDRHGILSLPPHCREAKEGSQNALTKAVEMTVRGKPGKPNPGFPPFPPPLDPFRIHIPTASTTRAI